MNKKEKKIRIFPLLIFIGILILLFNWVFDRIVDQGNSMSYGQVVQELKNENVKSFQVNGNSMTLYFHAPVDGETSARHTLADPEGFRREFDELCSRQLESGVLERYDFYPAKSASPYDYVFPLIIVGVVILLLWAFLMGASNSAKMPMNYAKTNVLHGQSGSKVTFEDVAGMQEEKKELQEVVDFLTNPEKFTRIGAKIPHGILLSGPPGTGKTLLARAVAGEAGVEFLSISGSDFMEMYVGVGASRVRDLFKEARMLAPAIIFIDEIDAIGRKRGSGMGGGHDEREQTLNQLLVEMDGFARSEGVIVLAATNRRDILDPALLRPGRFDRQVYVGVPDASEREQILRVHAKGKCLSENVDLKTVAMATAGFTGADLSNLLNEAAIYAARDDRPALDMHDMENAMMKVLAGPEKKNRVHLQKDLRMTAIHEAGHAVAMYSLPTHDPVRQISIIPRGNALGLTWTQPDQESTHTTRNEMYEQIVGLLGGRVAEELFLKDISTGASNDIERASRLARDMVGRYGMNKTLGTVSYTGGEELFIGRNFEQTRSYSERTAGSMDEEVKALIDKAYDHCSQILSRDAQKLEQVVEFLLKNETMSGNQFRQCMEGKPIEAEAEGSLFEPYKAE